ncbi:hypothetical protein B0H12DRAFT_1094914 [Mycena haematopus]|nr:hypothetical protein B0H12DRAFT_1094914 [Mycena haematopus]
MLWPHSLLLLLLAALAHANTEINNFAASERTDAPLLRARSWPTLRPRSTTRWALARAPYGTPLSAVCASGTSPPGSESESERCPHELWLALDTPDTYGRWTLRLSWPASTPTDFRLDVLDPRAAAALHLIPPEVGAPTTTRKYARIRAVDAGVRTPGALWTPNVYALFARAFQNSSVVSYPDSDSEEDEDEKVHLILTLEPLLFGVLPETVVPVLLMAIAVVVLLIHPGGILEWVQKGVDGLVREARRELEGKKEE